MDDDHATFHRAGDLLPVCPTETLAVNIPVPLNRRINQLRDELPAAGAGGGCRKHDLVAAMLHAVVTEVVEREGVEGLARRVIAYNQASAQEVLGFVADANERVSWPKLRRGRPAA